MFIFPVDVFVFFILTGKNCLHTKDVIQMIFSLPILCFDMIAEVTIEILALDLILMEEEDVTGNWCVVNAR